VSGPSFGGGLSPELQEAMSTQGLELGEQEEEAVDPASNEYEAWEAGGEESESVDPASNEYEAWQAGIDAHEAVDPASNEYEAWEAGGDAYESGDPFSNEEEAWEGTPPDGLAELEWEAAGLDPSAAELEPELYEQVPLGPAMERSLLLPQIVSGNRDENKLTNFVFWLRHPEQKDKKLLTHQTALVAEWLKIRDQLVRPALAQYGSGGRPPATGAAGAGAASSPNVPLGTLVTRIPGRKPFTYRFTPDDLLWTARFLTGEAGGRDDPQNRAILWAMFNRYAFFRDAVPGWGSFADFIRQYSTPLQPFLKKYGQVKAHLARCDSTFNNPGCNYQPTRQEVYPGTNVRKGQLKTFLALQARPWSQQGAAARRLAQQMLSGQIPNPIGNASEFGDTAVYFQREHGRTPSRAEWEAYTREYARTKGWVWLERAPHDQFRNNVLFINGKARGFPPNAAQVLPPAGATAGTTASLQDLARVGTAVGSAAASALTGAMAPLWGLAQGLASAPAAPASAAAADRELLYDGTTPAPGTVETRRSHLPRPPVLGSPDNRNRLRYENVINQFAAGKNPRYAQKRDANGKIKSTYCNIFCWDVTRAMGAEIPHWVNAAGEPVGVGKGNELNANATYDWLHKHGARYGWRKLSGQAEAQQLANLGHPVIAAFKKPGGIGHVSVIRPGTLTAEGAAMAQAGAKNFNQGRFHHVFARKTTAELWANDRGTVR